MPSPNPSLASSPSSSFQSKDELQSEGGSAVGDEGGERYWQTGWAPSQLHRLKKRLFTTPASMFDSFASPILFFRTAGLAVPASWHPIPSPAPTATSSSPTPHPGPDPEVEELSFGSRLEESGGVREAGTNLKDLRPGKTVQMAIDMSVSRKANLKFPPRDSTLQIPRALFITTATSTSAPRSNSNPTSKSNTQRTYPNKEREGAEEDEITPKAQAEEMALLMRRSVLLHEFKERVMWDEDLDPHTASEERVQILEVVPKEIGGAGEEEIERKVRQWIEESLS